MGGNMGPSAYLIRLCAGFLHLLARAFPSLRQRLLVGVMLAWPISLQQPPVQSEVQIQSAL